MDALKTEELERYLQTLWGPTARVLRCIPIGKSDAAETKGFGYGVPIRIDADVDGRRRSVVLEPAT